MRGMGVCSLEEPGRGTVNPWWCELLTWDKRLRRFKNADQAHFTSPHNSIRPARRAGR